MPNPADKTAKKPAEEMKDDELSDYQKFVNSTLKTKNYTMDPINSSELNLYLQKERIAVQLNPLMYWNLHKESFPSLYDVSYIFLKKETIHISDNNIIFIL